MSNVGIDSETARRRRNRAASRERARSYMRAVKLERGCIDCGFRAHPAALDFDHVLGEKKFSVGRVQTYGLETIKAEIAKCVVRCANCHRIATYERRESAA